MFFGKFHHFYCLIASFLLYPQFEYYVKWQGFPSTSNTWEPACNFLCPDMIRDYHEKKREEKRLSDLEKKKIQRRKSVSVRCSHRNGVANGVNLRHNRHRLSIALTLITMRVYWLSNVKCQTYSVQCGVAECATSTCAEVALGV